VRWGDHLASVRQGREKAIIMNLMALEGVPAHGDVWTGGRINTGIKSWSDGYAKGNIRYFPIPHAKEGCAALNGPKKQTKTTDARASTTTENKLTEINKEELNVVN
jgi:hypothetical protein